MRNARAELIEYLVSLSIVLTAVSVGVIGIALVTAFVLWVTGL